MASPTHAGASAPSLCRKNRTIGIKKLSPTLVATIKAAAQAGPDHAVVIRQQNSDRGLTAVLVGLGVGHDVGAGAGVASDMVSDVAEDADAVISDPQVCPSGM